MVDYRVESGQTYLFHTSKVSRVGQFASRWRALKEVEMFSPEERCAIGNTILPQVSHCMGHICTRLARYWVMAHHSPYMLCVIYTRSRTYT